MTWRTFGCLLIVLFVLPTAAAGATGEPTATSSVTFSEYRLSDATMTTLRNEWLDEIVASNPPGTWAPLKVQLRDDQLARMGLPSADVLRSRDYARPTMVDRAGNAEVVDLPALATFAGTGYFGIRPGAWVLLLSDGGIGWCSLAHVYGSPGSYKISTAGHCGKTGDTATMIAAFGNRAGVLNPVLLDIGKFSTSTDGGLGKDWALIDIDARYQHLVTPTMAFWGGPRGMFTATGAVASVTFPSKGIVPSVSVTPNPFLAQQIVHYGHGIGVGAGGTPRSATALAWGTTHFMFFGAISPGDSGSGSNTLGGDGVGAVMEAAGINTHLYVDPLMRKGLGIMGGTRATTVRGTLADGQLVGYPAPAPFLP
ncbi:MAG: S1 family peptidase [Actinomycetota bacterium]|nr:S1 family peptidase [Actinomycetota bacterium]